MSNNILGFEYEGEVIQALLDAGYCGSITEGAGSSSVGADADFVLDGVRHLVEVKKDSFAQMGGTSARYHQGEFEVASDSVDEATQEIIVSALGSRQRYIDDMLKFLGQEKFPFSCTREKWTEAQQLGLLKPINIKICKDTGFISNHYRKKGINYIQIGGAGLFYLAENPARLPVPRLDGQIDIELRAARSGSKKNTEGVSMVGGGLRAQARLKFRGTSPYTLDNPESIKLLMGNKWANKPSQR